MWLLLIKLFIQDILFCCLILICKEITVRSSQRHFSCFFQFLLFLYQHKQQILSVFLLSQLLTSHCGLLSSISAGISVEYVMICLEMCIFNLSCRDCAHIRILCSARHYKGQQHLHITSEMLIWHPGAYKYKVDSRANDPVGFGL